jgi:hypothetical protein
MFRNWVAQTQQPLFGQPHDFGCDHGLGVAGDGELRTHLDRMDSIGGTCRSGPCAAIGN